MSETVVKTLLSISLIGVFVFVPALMTLRDWLMWLSLGLMVGGFAGFLLYAMWVLPLA